MSEKKLIVVLGVHRSGTSVLSRSMQVLGGDTCGQLVEAWVDNPKGYWEDEDVVNLDNEILDALGMDWRHLRRLSSSDVMLLEKGRFLERGAQVVDSRLNVYPSFILKDPRMTGLFKFWKKIFLQGDYRTYLVLAIRSPISVAKSLERRNNIPFVQGGLLWLAHILEMLSESIDFTRVLVDYDRLLAAPERELQRVAKELDCEINKAELTFFKDEFIDLSLRHETVDAENIGELDSVFSLANDIYYTLLQGIDDRGFLEKDSFLQKLVAWERKFLQLSSMLEGFDSVERQLRDKSALIDSLEDRLRCRDNELLYVEDLFYKRTSELNQEAVKYLEIKKKAHEWKNALKIEREKTRKYTVEHTAEVVSTLFSHALMREKHILLLPVTFLRRVLFYKKYFYLRILQRSGLFDVVWYFQENPIAFASGVSPVEYYLTHGGVDHKDPHPLFQSKWYFLQLGKKSPKGIPPLLHYLRQGEKKGLQPNPCFHPEWYCREYPDIVGISPLSHYVLYGEKEGRKPCLCFEPHWYREKYLRNVWYEKSGGILSHYLYFGENEGHNPSPFFDTGWYREEYPEVSATGACLLGHYLNEGEKGGYRPNPYFFPKWYAESNPDICEEYAGLLQHYVAVGESEGRSPNPLFFPKWYLQQNPDLKGWEGCLLFHYIEWGEKEGRYPSPLFSPEWYRTEHGVQSKALPHYLERGEKEGLSPNPIFHPHWYKENNPDLLEQEICLLYHYLCYGEKEGRLPAAHFFPEWYRQHYMTEELDKGECALFHFLTCGDGQGYCPSPFFDSEWYAEEYGNIDMRGLTPYCHYLNTGQYEGFECVPWPMRQRLSLPVVPFYHGEERGFAEWSNAAIHLHVRSLDSLLSFLERLEESSLPLYLTMNEELWKSCEENPSLAEMLRSFDGQVTIRQIPSQGGEAVSALLLEYREFFSHFAYIGNFVLDERMEPEHERIFDLLLGEKGERLSEMEKLFKRDASLVYVGRSCLEEEPFSWGRSYGAAQSILEKYTDFCIDDFPVVDEAACFMFWAKQDVLQKFWGLPFSYHNFATDLVAGDGCLADALKKIFYVLATGVGKLYRFHSLNDPFDDYRRFEDLRDYSSKLVENDIQVLSYYLPQFHPTPENDEWHGKGFTEWTKVRAATPLFRGHWQQHIPHEDVGYYLLESSDVLRKQAKLMKCAGVTGMIFYHYWFTGKLILEKPAQMLLAEKDIDMPFCFCWANENWTKRWDGNDDEILLAQQYSEEDAEAFIRYLIPFFRDERYIKVDGRPMLHVYRPTAIPSPEVYLSVWKRVCREEGVPEPWVVATLTRGAEDPRDFGMDGAVERVLHDWTSGGVYEMKNYVEPYCTFEGSILNYPDVADYYVKKNEAKEFTYFRSIVPCWDNTARYGNKAYVLHNPTPEKFQYWLDETVKWTRKNLPADKRFLIVNAWNEWAEGNHLEADSRFGYAWLNCVGRSLAGIKFHEERALLPVENIPADLKVEICFTDEVERRLQDDSCLAERFSRQLLASTLFNKCRVVINSSLFSGGEERGQDFTPNYIIEIRRISTFNRHIFENMVMMALRNPTAAVIPNAYGADIDVVDMISDGAVDVALVASAPIVLKPVNWDRKRAFIRVDAFTVISGSVSRPDDPEVSCIIRFHRSGLFSDLDNALLCLQAMEKCRVKPFIVAQDLSEDQKIVLQDLVNEYQWDLPVKVKFYHSLDGRGDLRAKMMNEALQEVTTRYAAFLDADDLLFSHAWSWLIKRLQFSGKAIAFARVYKALSSRSGQVIRQRCRAFEYGTTYEDFVENNHSPVHSFLLDVTRLDLRDVIYHDEQKYMEDYLLLLQIVTPYNGDRLGLEKNFYIGDYLFRKDHEQTLALRDKRTLEQVLHLPEYVMANNLITAVKKKKNLL